MIDLTAPARQEGFGGMVGVSQQRVSQLVGDGVLPAGESFGMWLKAYCEHLREQAAGRASSELGGLDLVQERAALAREQRIQYEIRNAVSRGEYAPISLLTEVLAAAAQAVVDRLDLLPGQLRKVAPDLPDQVRTQLDTTIASARNEWVRATAELVVRHFDDDVSDPSEADQADPFETDEATA